MTERSGDVINASSARLDLAASLMSEKASLHNVSDPRNLLRTAQKCRARSSIARHQPCRRSHFPAVAIVLQPQQLIFDWDLLVRLWVKVALNLR
jgi:hypothetical protein